MNNRRSLVLAAVLFLGAIAAGFWGLMLTRHQPVPPAPVAQVVEQGVANVEDQTKHAVVVLTRDVAPHVALTADDLTLEKLRTAPVGSLTSIDQAVGRTPWRELNAGTWLNEQSFEIGGPLARMIRPDERALAVAIDEVAGAAGQFGLDHRDAGFVEHHRGKAARGNVHAHTSAFIVMPGQAQEFGKLGRQFRRHRARIGEGELGETAIGQRQRH